MDEAVVVKCARLGESMVESGADSRDDPGIPGFSLACGGGGAMGAVIPNPANGVAHVDSGIGRGVLVGAEVKIKDVNIDSDLGVKGLRERAKNPDQGEELTCLHNVME